MKIHTMGCRGSLPSPSGDIIGGRRINTQEFGGNTTCYYLEADNGQKVIIDAGSGIKRLGDLGEIEKADLFITHTHWDHIQGFPFFVPAYIKGNKINVYGEAKIAGDLVDTIDKSDPSTLPRVIQVNGVGMKEVLADQQKPRNFPAPLEYMAGLGDFYDFIPGGVIRDENGLRIEAMHLNHPGGCISYKFTETSSPKNKVTIISTDFEPDYGEKDEGLKTWWENADLVVADAQYEIDSKENPFMQGYGHSDAFLNVGYAKQAGVKRIVMTHYDMKSDDAYLRDLEQRARQFSNSVKVDFAREGKTYTV